jgi:anti-sigma B factor antagonist
VPEVSAIRSPTSTRRYAAPPFVCSWEMGGWDAAWVRVTGELDLLTSPRLRQTLGEAQRAARLVVLDLRELSFTDTSGIHVILDANRDAQREDGRLLIVRGPAQVDRVLTLTEVGKQVVIFDLAPAEPLPAPAHVLPPGVTV